MQALAARELPGIIDLTPGIRSLQIHYDDRRLPRERCSPRSTRARSGAARDSTTSRCRRASCTCRCPGTIPRRSWRSASTCSRCGPTRPGARATSSSSAASTASTSIDDVHRIVFDASYLVLGLGDVYLGAPVATPLDPRHRLVTTKYNPARTWTPENAVGIGGAYLCVYGMEGPGGYQFVGRTVPDVEPLSRDRGVPSGHALAAALLRPDPLLSRSARRSCSSSAPRSRAGGSGLKIEETTFRFADYRAFLRRQRRVDRRVPRAPAGRVRRGARALGRAAAAARGRRRAGRDARTSSRRARSPSGPPSRAASGRSPSRPATRVAAGDRLVVLETMKMETPVLAPASGVVVAVCCAPGALVRPGQTLMGLRVDA